MIKELAQRVFQARNIAHSRHWASKSYAEHVALGAFYDDAIGAIDAVIENYQGLFGNIGEFTTPIAPPEGNIRSYLSDEADWMESSLSELSNGSESISNLIQTLISVYTRTVFLLGLK